ncbi:type I methionyl aminopeptidase [Silvibacterium dinghuense]|uniref:Methionine aminopeptidase n=1 Tax=Silvibacterium dinghuense TaxID=1560006 RepID=A0A4Q1SC53_9BACT|nr:type I methionyl aminopeptidase [Silvibacterium dinghuense]RXS94595.1 type I methionyl aminopeptidase [Silvibacterium dinghuense]GGH15136.1 methionine aminopeptidase [Silvibacterium dinghuense]
MAIIIKTPQEIEKMRRSGQAVRAVLEHLRPFVVAGATTRDLEDAAAAKIKEIGARPAFQGYRGYPCVLCTSVNEEVVHGIPSEKRVLRDGDVVSIDTGVIIDGFYGDSAMSVAVGSKVDPKTQKLLDVTEASLLAGIEMVRPGATLGDVGAAVQDVVEAAGFSVVRDFVGHGIGTRLHEDPQVPNYGTRGKGQKLREGIVICIEPMVNAGKPEVQVLRDGWTAVTQDGSLSAHFEHTVAVTADGAMILTQ